MFSILTIRIQALNIVILLNFSNKNCFNSFRVFSKKYTKTPNIFTYILSDNLFIMTFSVDFKT